eukprot:TRINITY_DN1903_c0_g1_i1.p1 TRINITY_DN1903_c0_g1~~TRINITY_DN1903_c0_g1_i1.p1  ORF type:complete len:195 (+),score=42.34 TRINITY_DN1903_c0_g1_i1:714-1298(+)
MMKVILVLLITIAIAYAATPAQPVFPSAFNAEVSRYRGGQRPVKGEWYYSVSLNAERFDFDMIDHNDQPVHEAFYALHNESTGYLMTTAGGSFSCKKFNIGTKVFVPSLTGFTYTGLDVVQLNIPTPAYKWINSNQSEELRVYYNQVTAQNTPVRVDRSIDGKIDQFTFWAVNVGAQDITLFQIPAPIRNNLCQ